MDIRDYPTIELKQRIKALELSEKKEHNPYRADNIKKFKEELKRRKEK